MKYKWYDKTLIRFCLFFLIPFPKRIQKRIFATSRLQMYRFPGMCMSIRYVTSLLYGYDIGFDHINKCFPIFNRDNFLKVTGIYIYGYYWTKENDKYNRIKFLKWCEENVDKC